jgi:6-pyruvoyltetrahydropterin/6-carboxytetrahydropterin synthase
MSKLSTIEISENKLWFAAGHFAIFSATERERLHGHNYFVNVALTMMVGEKGLNFDWRDYEKKLENLCSQLHLSFLLPGTSPFLRIEEQGEYCYAHFGAEKIPFLKKDITVMPLHNITLEELSHWFLAQLTSDAEELRKNALQKVVVKISSTPGTWASASWAEIENKK